MSTADEVALLRARADSLEELDGLRSAYDEATAAYAVDPNPSTKEAFLAAKYTFADTRSAHRAAREEAEAAEQRPQDTGDAFVRPDPVVARAAAHTPAQRKG